MAARILVDPLSCVSLSLECLLQGTVIGKGTGFIVIRNGTNYLITNWHVVTGRDPNTGQPMSSTGAVDPDTIGIWHHDANRLGSWHLKTERLIAASTGNHLWREHPLGRQIDVIALPLSTHEDTRVYNLDISLAQTDLVLSPSEPVSIVGFPFGIAAAGKFPIWKTGHIASDIDLHYEDKPVFLVDATTTPGMSGSPVFARRLGMHRSSTGWNIGGGDIVRFLGVYSGRIREESDVGMVWKPGVIDEILRS
ncbi:MAG: serine protease [Dehalococcoidia bacterium]|nr:MAG: serine protease [Dehalococcoidia bacterium]